MCVAEFPTMISVFAVSACTKDTNKTTNTASNTGVYILSNKAGNVRKRNNEERSRNHVAVEK